jgi:hypothetical protein
MYLYIELSSYVEKAPQQLRTRTKRVFSHITDMIFQVTDHMGITKNASSTSLDSNKGR